MSFAVFSNLLLILLCGAVLVQSVRMMRSFRAVKDGGLQTVVLSLDRATGQAREVLADLKHTLRTDAAANARTVAQGEAMREELTVMVGIANAVAERIAEVSVRPAAKLRADAKPKVGGSPKSGAKLSPPTDPDAGSRLETPGKATAKARSATPRGADAVLPSPTGRGLGVGGRSRRELSTAVPPHGPPPTPPRRGGEQTPLKPGVRAKPSLADTAARHAPPAKPDAIAKRAVSPGPAADARPATRAKAARPKVDVVETAMPRLATSEPDFPAPLLAHRSRRPAPRKRVFAVAAR